MDEGAQKRNIENMIKLAQTITSQLQSKHPKTTIYWNDIWDAVKRSSTNAFVEEQDVKRQLNELVKIVPAWLLVTTMPSKTLIKLLNKKSDYEIG